MTEPQTTNFAKYHSANPLVRFVTQRFLQKITRIVADTAPCHVLDIGCGEGLVLRALREAGLNFAYTGIDLLKESLAYARERFPHDTWIEGDFLALPAADPKPDLVLCLEVIEHLPSVPTTLSAIRRHNAPISLLSVPWEPWFRIGNLIRGARWATLGNHPEHVQHFSPNSFHSALAQHWGSVEIQTSLPWIIAVCRL